jgi:hypothetical protein
MTPNRPTLDDLLAMESGAIAALPTDLLALLMEEAAEAAERAKRIKDRLDRALDLKYSARAAAARRAESKDTGTVRFDDGGFIVVADLPKRVKWDQAKLAAIVERIRVAGEDPAEYLSIEFKVSERAYGAWPESICSAFTLARTVTVGRPSYQIVSNQEVSK